MESCPLSSPGAFHHYLSLTTSILSLILRFYFAFQCARILFRAIDNTSQAPRVLPFEEIQSAVIQTQPQPQPDVALALLDEDIDNIAVPVLEPEKPGSAHGSDLSDSHGLLDEALDELTIPPLKPNQENQATSPAVATPTLNTAMGTRKPLLIPTPWDGKINWAISGPSIFDDEEEELDAVFYRPSTSFNKSASKLWLFQYGVRYMPPAGASNAYRTVKIDCPSSPGTSTLITTNHILGALRDVELYSAHLFRTAYLTGSNTAMVVFIHQRDAFDFLQRTARSGLRIGAVNARASLINTPTYPIPADIDRLITQEGYSRCLVVCNLRETLKTELVRVLFKRNCLDFVEALEDGYVAGEVCVRFHSVKRAATAFEALKRHPCFGNCQFRFQKPARPI
ncbi:hypothetical protein PHISP_03326 [Aspergillus sp. HF37]|nr:hypothetical protein PHISP_03326 [Aspergillus sp. HF37]